MGGFALFGLAWCVLSLVFVFRAARFALDERKFERTCVTATGLVVGEEQRTRKVSSGSGPRREVSYSYPVVEFRTSDGREIRTTPNINVAHAYAVGSTVEISYLPSNPETIRIAGDSVARYGPGLAVGVGALFFLVGVGMLAGALMSSN